MLTMTMKLKVLMAGGVLFFAQSAQAGDEMMAVTPSGRTEMVFLDANLAKASSKLANTCLNRGLTVISNDETEVVCEAKLGVLQGALTQALIGNSYSTPPRQFIKFNLVQNNQDSRVQATSWTETQMAFGQMRRADHTNDDSHNNMMGFMALAGAEFLSGTSFPNYAFLGVGGDQILEWKKGRKKKFGLVVTEVFEDSTAEQIGIQVDDRITSINGKTFKNQNQFVKRLRKAEIGQPLKIELLRNGQSLMVEGLAAPRPTVYRERPKSIPESEVNEAETKDISSVKNRLQELDELKSSDLISEEEYNMKRQEILSDL